MVGEYRRRKVYVAVGDFCTNVCVAVGEYTSALFFPDAEGGFAEGDFLYNVYVLSFCCAEAGFLIIYTQTT